MFYFDSSQNIRESTYVTVDVFCHCKVQVFSVKATVHTVPTVQPHDTDINTGEMKHVSKCTVTENDFENK